MMTEVEEGSGTTVVVCKQLGRQFIGFEISKEYCDIANRRLAQESLFSIPPPESKDSDITRKGNKGVL